MSACSCTRLLLQASNPGCIHVPVFGNWVMYLLVVTFLFLEIVVQMYKSLVEALSSVGAL